MIIAIVIYNITTYRVNADQYQIESEDTGYLRVCLFGQNSFYQRQVTLVHAFLALEPDHRSVDVLHAYPKMKRTRYQRLLRFGSESSLN